MMDKKPHIKPYLYGMLAGSGAIALSIIFFFLIYRFDGFGSAISTLTGILMPFIYGAVIAYLLKPVCNTIENFLRRFIPERMKGLSAWQKAEALISVAHPDFREELIQEAEKLHIWRRSNKI